MIMVITTQEALDRYQISRGTLDKRRERIEELDGIIKGDGGSSPHLYKTSVLDGMARRGELGNGAFKAILNIDAAKESA